jgi:hypothetical protein
LEPEGFWIGYSLVLFLLTLLGMFGCLRSLMRDNFEDRLAKFD